MGLKPLVLASALALPDHATTWTTNLPVGSITTLGNGGVVIELPQGTNPSCRNNGSWFEVVPNQYGQTAATVKQTLSIALAAFATSKTLTVAYDVTGPYCYVAIIRINP